MTKLNNSITNTEYSVAGEISLFIYRASRCDAKKYFFKSQFRSKTFIHHFSICLHISKKHIGQPPRLLLCHQYFFLNLDMSHCDANICFTFSSLNCVIDQKNNMDDVSMIPWLILTVKNFKLNLNMSHRDVTKLCHTETTRFFPILLFKSFKLFNIWELD